MNMKIDEQGDFIDVLFSHKNLDKKRKRLSVTNCFLF